MEEEAAAVEEEEAEEGALEKAAEGRAALDGNPWPSLPQRELHGREGRAVFHVRQELL